MNIKSCFLRWGIPLLLLAAFLAAVFALNRVDKVALVNREGQTFEKGVVVDILQDNLMPDGSRVGEQRVLVRMTTRRPGRSGAGDHQRLPASSSARAAPWA